MLRKRFRFVAFNILGSNGENEKVIANYLENDGADLVAIDESGLLLPYLERLRESYPCQAGCKTGVNALGRCGDVLLLSTLPLLDVEVKKLNWASVHQTISARLEIDGQNVNVIATHLL